MDLSPLTHGQLLLRLAQVADYLAIRVLSRIGTLLVASLFTLAADDLAIKILTGIGSLLIACSKIQEGCSENREERYGFWCEN